MKKYPPYPVSRAARIVIMCLLIASFFVIAPLVILYTSGFRYDITERVVQTTGVLSVDVKTENVQITVNNSVVYNNNPLRLPQLTPDLYTVHIEKPGYHSWKQTVQVRSNETTYIKDVVLYKDRLPVAILYKTESTIPKHLSDIGSLLYYQKVANTSTKHSLLNLREQTTHTLIEKTENNYIGNISFEKDSTILSVSSSIVGENNISLSYIDGLKPTSYSTYRNINPLNSQSHPTQPIFYAYVSPWVEKFTPTEQALLRKTSSSLWYVDNNEIVWEYINEDQKITDGDKINISVPESILTIEAVTNNLILARAQSAGFYLFERKENAIVNTQRIAANSLRFDPIQNRWYLWSDWELWQVDGNNINLLHRSAVKIKDIKSLDNVDAILITTDNSLVAFDIKYYSHTPLLENVSINEVTVDRTSRQIFYIGTDESGTEGVYSLDY